MSAYVPEPTIVQVRYRADVCAWWATETTADCRRYIGQRGAWPSLADAMPVLRKMRDRGEDVRVSATAAQVAAYRAEVAS